MFTDIKVGYSCNNQCIHCVIAPSKAQLAGDGLGVDDDTSAIKHCIDEAAAAGSEGVVLTGGEVTIRPDFAELVAYSQERGLAVTVQTNGRALHSRDKTDFLRQLRPVQFVVAIHGPSAPVHDDITCRSGSFDETMNAIANLLAISHMKVVGKVVISRRNMSQIAKTVELLSGSGISKIVLAFPHAMGFPRAAFEAVVPRYAELQPELYRALDVVRELDMSVTLETVPYCTIPEAQASWMCSQDIRYRLQREASSAAIHNPRSAAFENWDILRPLSKHKPASCADCLMDEVCEGPWSEYVEHFGDSEFVPLNDRGILSQFGCN